MNPKATDAVTRVIEKKQENKKKQEVRESCTLSRVNDAKPHTLRNISHSSGILYKHKHSFRCENKDS